MGHADGNRYRRSASRGFGRITTTLSPPLPVSGPGSRPGSQEGNNSRQTAAIAAVCYLYIIFAGTSLRAVDDQHRHQRHGRERGPDRTDRPRRRTHRAPHGAGPPRRREPPRNRPAVAGRRMHGGRGGRHPFHARGGRRRRAVRGQGAHQPGQLPQRPRPVRGAHRHVPRPGRGAAHRREPRLARETGVRPVGRHAAGHGRLGDGVPAHLPREGVRPSDGLDEVE